MKCSNGVLFVVSFFFFLLFFYSFYKESYVNNTPKYQIPVKVPNQLITKIVIEYGLVKDAPKDDSWFNINEIIVRDRGNNPIDYWQGSNSITFKNKDNPGWFPRPNLYDNAHHTFAHSLFPAETITIELGDGRGVGSVQITNRTDCCWNRITDYNLVFYSKDNIVAVQNLDQLGEQGITCRYNLVYG
jgi:hypothetical protein